MTELLYYQDSSIEEFSAEVISLKKDKKKLIVELDKTAFYPEGGGQPADTGIINNFQVIDVQKKDGIISHTIKASSESDLNIGSIVNCKIDMLHRLDYMQQHTGQHLISAAFFRTEEINTVSVNQGEEFTSVEVATPELSKEQIENIEKKANEYISDSISINTAWTDEEGLGKYNLRRPTKHKEGIRIVDIPEIDCVACGGVHLSNTSETRLIKFIYQEKIRGNTRTFWKIGERAYKDYEEKTNVINQLNNQFSARQFELPEKAKALIEQNNNLKYKYKQLEDNYASLEADSLYEENTGNNDEHPCLILKIFSNEEKSFITSLAKAFSEKDFNAVIVLFNKTEQNVTWTTICTKDSIFDYETFKKEVLSVIDAKGGGRSPIWQGIVKKPEELETAENKLKELFQS
ncbi:MAG: alanyl-tRNA editing protein [Spirochaetales bacterium]|nr:alanyl-tRNA editing protein [Spirochaetales bacterium]